MKNYTEETLDMTEEIINKIRRQGLFSDKIEIEWKTEQVTNLNPDGSELMITVLVPKITIGQLSR